jgi:nitroreductase
MSYPVILGVVMFLKLAQQRRTVYQFTDQPVEDESVLTCLNAAIWAPNHKLTEPWRFYILGTQTQKALKQTYAGLRADKRAEPGSVEHQSIFEKACERFLAYPKIVLVGQKRSDDPIQSKEDYAACACAIQNFQLMASELGLGVQWSTGPIIHDIRTYQLLEIDASEIELIGILYMGYPQPQCLTNQKRRPINDISRFYD